MLAMSALGDPCARLAGRAGAAAGHRRGRPDRIRFARAHGTGVVRAAREAHGRPRQRHVRVQRSRGNRHLSGELHDRGGAQLQGPDRVLRVRFRGRRQRAQPHRARGKFRVRRAPRMVGHRASQVAVAQPALPVHRPVLRHLARRLHRVSQILLRLCRQIQVRRAVGPCIVSQGSL